MEIKNRIVVDIGNTRGKAAVFNGSDLLEVIVFSEADMGPINKLIQQYSPTHSLLCSVAGNAQSCIEVLQHHTIFKQLSADLKWPFASVYSTPQTLGMDRVAGVAGALTYFPNQSCLVIDAGTCITYDVITDEGVYRGGAISPGLQMRLNAMHTFTQRLPQLTIEQIEQSIGDSTRTSMLSGAYFGLVNEINGFAERYQSEYGPMQVLICGGDAALFDKHMKKGIFAAPDLVLHGLNKILELNA